MTAQNGLYGFESAKEYKPDLILLDINLPDIDGYQVLKMLRNDEATEEIPVIAISSNSMPLDIERGLQAGFNEYLTKPVKMESLVDILNRYSDNRRSTSN
jgi:CheY-like chemotaxis protein